MAKKSSTPSNVTNPSLYSRVKSEAKRKFDVYPSAYANAWLVKTYKKRGGGYKGAKKAEGGEVSKKDLRPVPAGNKGLGKLPTRVRNKMGFMEDGGKVKKSVGRFASKKLEQTPGQKKERIKARKERENQKKLEYYGDIIARKKSPQMKKKTVKKFNNGGGAMVQARGCGAIMNSKRKPTKVPRS